MDRASDPPVASVIVPCKGHTEELSPCLRSLERQVVDFAYETIVVDSASDPGVAATAGDFPHVRLVRSDGDLLPGPARNLGLQRARGTFVGFIDADCRADPDWLARAVEGLAGGAEMVGGPVLDALPWHPVAVTDNMLQFADFLPGRPDGPASYFPGCNMALRLATLLALDGFPSTQIVAGEDTRLCDRLLDRRPGSIRFVRRMQVRHLGRTGLGEFMRHQSAFGYARGLLGLRLSPAHRRWGARSISMPAIVVKRLTYIAGRNLQWDLPGALRMAVLFPLVLLGLAAWARGFRRGCGESAGREERA